MNMFDFYQRLPTSIKVMTTWLVIPFIIPSKAVASTLWWLNNTDQRCQTYNSVHLTHVWLTTDPTVKKVKEHRGPKITNGFEK